MDIVIQTHNKVYRSTDHHFDFKLWYVFIKEAFERYTTEQIDEIEKAGGWIELNLDLHPHPERNDYVLKHAKLILPNSQTPDSLA